MGAFLEAMQEEIARTKRNLRRTFSTAAPTKSEWISFCILHGADEPDQEDLDWYDDTYKDVTPLGKTQ